MIQEISREFNFDTWKNKHLKSDLGIVATGKSYYDLLGALKQLHISENEVEIYKPMIIWPPDIKSFREFAKNKREIIVIEEKQSFYENHIKNELFNDTHKPRIIGKYDELGKTLFRQNANLDADLITHILGKRLAHREPFQNRQIEKVLNIKEWLEDVPSPINVKRPPAYCSGCQHRTALEISGHNVLEGTVQSMIVENKDLDGNPVFIEITPKHLMGIGIGCSTMSIIDSLVSNRAIVVGPMESEGLLWMGASAFSYRIHADQGCGDGTYFHSARLNISFIRDAIEHLKVHYEIEDTHQTMLYVDNNVVAMTGGQRPVGQDDPETAIANIQKEGIKNIAVVAEYPEEFQHLKQKYGVDVYHKSDTLKVKEEFSIRPGLSVIWYVQKCGIEKVRERRRNQDLAPKVRVHVNTDVCEDCGDCGVEAKCASVWKTDTIFGPKVKIHQFSCVEDYACAKGECPSYIRVYTRSGNSLKKADLKSINLSPKDIPHPVRKINKRKIYEIYSIGIGGWGLMTAYEILARAATTEGKNVVKEDDTGLSQKGGEIRNSLKISYPIKDIHEGFQIESGGADLYMASDMIGAINPQNLRATSPGNSIAIVNTVKVPTMPMIVGHAVYPDKAKLIEIINNNTAKKKNIYVNATEIVENLLQDFKPTNLFLLGLAFQAIEKFPIEHPESIEEAIQMNGVDVEKNIQAFRYGRLYAVDPERVLKVALPEKLSSQDMTEEIFHGINTKNRLLISDLTRRVPFGEPFNKKFNREVIELSKYQNAKYAEQFVDFLEKIYKFDQKRFPSKGLQFTQIVSDNLYDVMAYKDEYRVAELLTRKDKIQQIIDQYEPGEVRKIRYLLRPPILENIPLIKNLKYLKEKFEKKEKWEVPAWPLILLKRFKFLRGTVLDLFMWGSEIRKLEIKAIPQYMNRIENLTFYMSESNYQSACDAASYPSLATGYDKVKKNHFRKAEEFWAQKHGEVFISRQSLSLELELQGKV